MYMEFLQGLFLPLGFQSQNIINPHMPEVEIFEFVHDIHVCYIENFKEQEFEEKKLLLYSIVELWGIPKMEL